MVTTASATGVANREPDNEPETIIVSSPSPTVSASTVRLKVVLAEDCPAAMVIAAGAVAVKSLVAPSAAVPPATATATIVPPAGAVTPVGKAAVTVMVCVLSELVSATVAGSTVRTARSLAGMVTTASATGVADREPDNEPETIIVSSPSAAVSAITVTSKVVSPVDCPAAMVMETGMVAVKSWEAPSTAVPPATATATFVPPAGAVTPEGNVAVTVMVSVLSELVSFTIAGETLKTAPSLREMVTTASATGVADREPDNEPETIIVSSPSLTVSASTVRLKAVLPEDCPAAMKMAAGAVAVKSLEAPATAVPPATVTATIVPPAGAVTPGGKAAVTVMRCVLSKLFSATTAGETLRTASGTPPSLPGMVTAAPVTAVEDREPDNEPETVIVSSTSATVSALTVTLNVVLPVACPAGMVIAAGEVAVKSVPETAVPPATVTVTVVPSAGAVTPGGRAAVTVTVCVLSELFSVITAGETVRTAAGSVMVNLTGLTVSPAARPETVKVSAPSVLVSDGMTIWNTTEPLMEPAGMVKARLSGGRKSTRVVAPSPVTVPTEALITVSRSRGAASPAKAARKVTRTDRAPSGASATVAGDRDRLMAVGGWSLSEMVNVTGCTAYPDPSPAEPVKVMVSAPSVIRSLSTVKARGAVPERVLAGMVMVNVSGAV